MKQISTRLLLLFSALVPVGCVLADTSPDTEQEGEEVATAASPVQTRYRTVSPHFEYAKTLNDTMKAVGAIIHPALGVPSTRGTCGSTFISPHYAITAAHCVPSSVFSSPSTDTFAVQWYDIKDVTMTKLANAEIVSGLFPAYTRTALTSADGYRITSNTCHIESRCSDYYGRYNCPFADDVDVALLHCPNRLSNLTWVPVASSDAVVGQAVDMYWFHEVLDMPTQPPGGGGELQDHYDHYTFYDGTKTNNYHYRGVSNQILPLHSLPWSDGTQRKLVAANIVDMFGCHGTSGSGILTFTAGKWSLLGAAINPIGDAWTNRLCVDGDAIAKGQQLLRFTPRSKSQALAASAWADPKENGDISSVLWSPTGTVPATSKLAVCHDGMLYQFMSNLHVHSNATEGNGAWAHVATLPAGHSVLSATCARGLLYYLRTNHELWYLDTAGGVHYVGYPWAAADIAGSEDMTLDFPYLWALNEDKNLYRNLNGGLDSSWVWVDYPWNAQQVSSSHSALFAMNTDGSFWTSRQTLPLAWHNIGSAPTGAIDITSASVGQSLGPVYLYALASDGRIHKGTLSFEAPY